MVLTICMIYLNEAVKTTMKSILGDLEDLQFWLKLWAAWSWSILQTREDFLFGVLCPLRAPSQ